MSAAERWIRSRLADAPSPLVESMVQALPAEAPSVPDALAAGALELLGSLRGDDAARDDALPLLAADALLTAAFEAQAESDPEGIGALSVRWGVAGRLGAVAEAGGGSV